MPLTLEAALARLSRWQGKTATTTFLAGGITNRNYRVDVDGDSVVLRLSGANTELLGIDRRTEYAANRAAAALGLAPEVVDFIEPEGCLVTRFIAGRPLAPEAMRQPENIAVVAAALRRVHTLPPIPGTFSAFRVVADYRRLAAGFGVQTFPADFEKLLAAMRTVETAVAAEGFTPMLCHNDLLNENFMLDDATGALIILDWEYAGMGDPYFDLANFAAHHEFADEHDQALLTAYFGAASLRHLARLKLMKIISDFREAMWGLLQQGISQLDFDFRGYADKYFARVTAGFSQPAVPDWLRLLGQAKARPEA